MTSGFNYREGENWLIEGKMKNRDAVAPEKSYTIGRIRTIEIDLESRYRDG